MCLWIGGACLTCNKLHISSEFLDKYFVGTIIIKNLLLENDKNSIIFYSIIISC